MNSDLLPCPFCGSAPERDKNPLYGDMSMVKCRQCGAELFDRKWNDRATVDYLTPDVRAFILALLAADTCLEVGAVWIGNPEQRKAAYYAISKANQMNSDGGSNK